MKHFFSTLFLLLFALSVRAQTCATPQSGLDLWANNIKALILNGGSLFTDGLDGQFIPNPDAQGNGPATIYASGLWLGGFDPGGNLLLSANSYRLPDKTDFWAGPLAPSQLSNPATCANWDRVFSVKGERIKAFLEQLPDFQNNTAAAVAQFPEIMGWPALGNPHFSAVWSFSLPANNSPLAGFVDSNDDDIYNPLDGDYPAVVLQNKSPFVPAQHVWCVFNDAGAGQPHATTGRPMGMEVQLSAWAFNCTDKPELNNTIFTSHKLLNRAPALYNSIYIGMWTDFDLGCPTDDYIGCLPDLNTYFAYNQDQQDGNVGSNCSIGGGNLQTFGNTPPVQSVTFLNHFMDRFILQDNPSIGVGSYGVPQTPLQYYNNLNGRFPNGNPIYTGGSGLTPGTPETNYIFPGDPGDPQQWSMCTATIPSGDFRALGSSYIGNFPPGGIYELTSAWTTHEQIPQPCNLGNVKENIGKIRNLFVSDFAGVCSPLLSHVPQIADKAFFSLAPNPAHTEIVITYEDVQVQQVKVFDNAGRLIQQLNTLPEGRVRIPVGAWASGMYQVQVISEKGAFTRSFYVNP